MMDKPRLQTTLALLAFLWPSAAGAQWVTWEDRTDGGSEVGESVIAHLESDALRTRLENECLWMFSVPGPDRYSVELDLQLHATGEVEVLDIREEDTLGHEIGACVSEVVIQVTLPEPIASGPITLALSAGPLEQVLLGAFVPATAELESIIVVSGEGDEDALRDALAAHVLGTCASFVFGEMTFRVTTGTYGRLLSVDGGAPLADCAEQGLLQTQGPLADGSAVFEVTLSDGSASFGGFGFTE